MKSIFADLIMNSHRINRQHVQLLLTLAALAMLVLGIGAPSDGGGAT
jgi:hypothetical protein